MEIKSLKNILIYGLAFVFLLNVVYGSKSFAFGKTSPVTTKIDNAQLANTNQVVVVKVVAVVPAEKIVTNTNTIAAVTSCNVSTQINLNQPADCFSLSVAERQPLATHLFVQTLQTHQQVVVNFSAQKIQAPDYLPAAPDAAGIPTLPATFFIFAAAVLVFRRKLINPIISLGNKLLISHQSYYAIPMRC